MFNWTKAVLLTFGEDQHGGMSELDTVKCFHCGTTMIMQPYQKPDTCKGCMQPVCEVCSAKRELGDPCYPEEQRLLDFEKAVGRGMGNAEASRKYGL